MATLPAYGPAVWTDWTDNWRKADGDFLQSRSILRYATDAGKPASGEVGQIIFTADNARLNMWTTKWIQVLSSENLNLVTSGTQARLTHPSAGGAGLLFSSGPNLITSEVDFKGSRVEASTMVVYTTTGGANRTARLTTTTTDLASDSPVIAPQLTLNGSTNASVPYVLNVLTGTARVGGAATFGSTITAAGIIQGSNVLISGAQSIADNAATRKDYVLEQVAKAVPIAGGTMTGMLTLSSTVPSSGNHATNKTYVDTQRDSRVAKAGDTMTGTLTFQDADLYSKGIQLNASTHVTSDRAAVGVGDWQVGQDAVASGAHDLYIYHPTPGMCLGFNTSGDAFFGLANDTAVPSVQRSTGMIGAKRRSGEGECIRMASADAAPYLTGYNWAGTARYGYLQFLDGTVNLCSELQDGWINLKGTGGDLRLQVQKDITVNYKRFQVNHAPFGTWAYTNAPYLGYVSGVANNVPSYLSLHSPGVAPILRATGIVGERLEVVNNQASAYVPMGASAFTVSSAADTKVNIKDVPSIRSAVEALPVKNFRRRVRPLVLSPGDRFESISKRWEASSEKRRALTPRPQDEDSNEHGDTCDETKCGGTTSHPCADFRNYEHPRIGVIAEDVAAVLPGVAVYDKDGKPVGWDVDQMCAVLIKEVQELSARIVQLESGQQEDDCTCHIADQRVTALEAVA